MGRNDVVSLGFAPKVCLRQIWVPNKYPGLRFPQLSETQLPRYVDDGTESCFYDISMAADMHCQDSCLKTLDFYITAYYPTAPLINASKALQLIGSLQCR